MIKIQSFKDFFAGLMFVAFGATAVWLAQAYPFGSAGRMGPAYFPTLVGALLTILGGIVSLRGLAVSGQKPGSFHYKPLILVLANHTAPGGVNTFKSDDFNARNINRAVWTIRDRSSECAHQMRYPKTDSARVVFVVPGGSSHEIYPRGAIGQKVCCAPSTHLWNWVVSLRPVMS